MIAMIQDSADFFGLEQPDLDLDKGWKVVLVCFGEHQRSATENGLHYLQIMCGFPNTFVSSRHREASCQDLEDSFGGASRKWLPEPGNAPM